MTRVMKDYAILCEYVRRFMDAYLKKDGKGLAFLGKTPGANGVPPGVMYLESKSGLPVPPTEAEFFALLQTGGLERMKEVFYRVKQKDPGAYIFSKENMNRLGAKFLNAGQIQEAIEIFKMNAAAYPENWGVYNNLGAAYAKAGSRELALKNFELALKYNYQIDKKEEEAYNKLKQTIELLKKK
jgi:tetratricopeptide (TPR) repeat protein